MAEQADGEGRRSIVTKVSPRPVGETVDALTAVLAARGVRVFAIIDQAAAAREAGLSLRDTVLVVFGSPAAGTPVMQSSPLAALDLPLKVLVWDDDGATKVSYLAPEALAARYELDKELARPLSVVDALTDAVVGA